MKRCPACSGIVADDASICWHCGGELTPEPGAAGDEGPGAGTIVGARLTSDDSDLGGGTAIGPGTLARGQTLYRRPGLDDAPAEPDPLPGAAAFDAASTDLGLRAKAEPVVSPDENRIGAPSGSVPAVPHETGRGQSAPGGPGTIFGMHVLDEDDLPASEPAVQSRTIFGVRGAVDDRLAPGDSAPGRHAWADDTDPGAVPGAAERGAGDAVAAPDAVPHAKTIAQGLPGAAGDWLDDISAWLKGEPGEDVRAEVAEGAAPAKQDAPTAPVASPEPSPPHPDLPVDTDPHAALDLPAEPETAPAARLAAEPGAAGPDTRPVDGAAMIMRRPGGRRRRNSGGPAGIAGVGAHAEKSDRKDAVGGASTTRKRRPSDDVRVPETVSLDARYPAASASGSGVDPSRLPPGIRHGGDPIAFADTGAMPALGDPRSLGGGNTTVPDAAFSVIEDVRAASASASAASPADTGPIRGPSTDANASVSAGDYDAATAPTAPTPTVAPPTGASPAETTLPEGTGLTQQLKGLLDGHDPRAEAAAAAPAPSPPPPSRRGSGLAWGPIIAVAVVVIGALVGAALALGILIDG